MPSRRHASRFPEWLSLAGEHLSLARLVLLGAFLIGFPFALGGRADWALPTACLVNALGLALLALEMACSRKRLRWHVAWLIAGLLLAVLCLQVVSVSSLVAALSPNAEALWQRAREAGFTDLASRFSLAPARTRVALLMLTQIGLTGWLIYNTFTTRRRLVILSACVAAAALANALAAFAPTLLGGEPLYAGLGIRANPLSGTFLNRNHFGSLLALGLIQLAGLAWAIFQAKDAARETGHHHRSLDEQLDERRGPLLLLLALASVPVAMGLLFSLSRGAAIGATAGFSLFTVLGLRGSNRNTRRTVFLVTALLLGAILLAGIQALTDLWDRYESLVTLGNIGLTGRWTVWCETMELLRRFPLCGIGLDAFERVSPLVESGFAAGKISFHAHNDYLELLAEVGIPLGSAILLLIVLALVHLLRRVHGCKDRLARTLGIAAWCGLLGVALHEGVDYSLRAPSNAFLTVALAVLCLLTADLGRRKAVAAEEDARDNAAPQRRGLVPRLSLAGMGIAILLAGLWSFPREIRAGAALMDLRAVVAANTEPRNTGGARETQASYCVDAARMVLDCLPGNERALYVKTAYAEVLAACLSQELAGKEVTAEQHALVTQRVFASRDAARELCREFPVAGFYQALYARQLNLSAWYDPAVAIPDIVRAFETAHANYPNVPQVTWLCLQAFSEILDVDRDELSAEDLVRLEKIFGDMGKALLEQQPGNSADVLQRLQRVFPEPDDLITVTPKRLLCYEPLYDLLFRQAHYTHCVSLLETMEQINRERFTRQNTEDVSLYELTRTHPKSREEEVLALARRRLTLASARGADELYAELRQAELDARRALCEPILTNTRQAAEAGDYYRALRQAKVAVARFPEIPEVRANLTGLLLTVGESNKALECLEPLMWQPDIPPAVIHQALWAADSLLTDRSGPDKAALLGDVLRVMQAETEGPESVPLLAAVQGRLAAWPSGPGRAAEVARHGHLALFYAGRAAELAGSNDEALDLYLQALQHCPFHHPSMERLAVLPESVAAEAQENLLQQLEAAGVGLEDLRQDLVVPAHGVVLRYLAIDPPEISPSSAVTLTVAVEVTNDMLTLPALSLTFGCSDGSTFVGRIGDKDWDASLGRPRVGQVLIARVERVPAIAALQAGHGLPDGPVTARIQGAGRDTGFTYYCPAFTVRRAEPPEAK